MTSVSLWPGGNSNIGSWMLICASILSQILKVIRWLHASEQVSTVTSDLQESGTDRSLDQKEEPGPILPVSGKGGAPIVTGLWREGSTRSRSLLGEGRTRSRSDPGRWSTYRKRAGVPCSPEKVRAAPKGELWKTRPLEYRGVYAPGLVHLVHFDFNLKRRIRSSSI